MGYSNVRFTCSVRSQVEGNGQIEHEDVGASISKWNDVDTAASPTEAVSSRFLPPSAIPAARVLRAVTTEPWRSVVQ